MSHLHPGESSDLIAILTKEQKQINKILSLIYDYVSAKNILVFSGLSKDNLNMAIVHFQIMNSVNPFDFERPKEDFMSQFTIKV